MGKQQIIHWTPAMYRRFKKAYDQLVANGAKPDDTFMFGGDVFVVGYAKYLIEYLELNFKGENNANGDKQVRP